MDYALYRRFTLFTVIFAFAITLVDKFIAVYVRELGYSQLEISWLFAVGPLAIILLFPAVGYIAEVTGRRAIILTAVLVQMLAFTFYLYADLPMLIMARILHALSTATVIHLSLSKIETSLDEKKRGSFTGKSLALINTAGFIGPLIGGVLASMYFIQVPFYLAMVILLIAFFYVYKKKTLDFHQFHRKQLLPHENIKILWKYPQLKVIGMLGFLTHMIIPLTSVFLPIFVIEQIYDSYALVGVVGFCYAFFHVGQPIWGKLCDKWSSKNVLITGMMLLSAGLLMLSFAGSIEFLIASVLVMGLGGAFWNVSALTKMNTIAVKIHHESVVIASYKALAKIGHLISFLLLGYIVTYLSFGAAALVLAVICAVGGLAARKHLS